MTTYRRTAQGLSTDNGTDVLDRDHLGVIISKTDDGAYETRYYHPVTAVACIRDEKLRDAKAGVEAVLAAWPISTYAIRSHHITGVTDAINAEIERMRASLAL